MARAYTVVDVFSDVRLKGNPVGVVLDAQGLDGAAMQAIARWTNLSETTFVLPAAETGADYRLRIFTPGDELPFAGHPTLGSAHAVINAGLVAPRDGRLVQACGVGLVEIAVSPERLDLTLPPARITPLSAEDAEEMAGLLGHPLSTTAPPALVDVGPVWAIGQAPDIETLVRSTPDFTRCAAFERRLGITGLTLFAVAADGAGIETRSYAPACGINEDPVCGSGNGAVAAFRAHYGQLGPGAWRYTASQGRCVGRDGKVELSGEGATIRVGGACVTTLEGVLAV